MTSLYPLETMYRIGGGDIHRLSYDFTFIPFDQYQRFFNTLPNVIYKKCENIRFSCDFAREYNFKLKMTKARDPKKEQIVSDSIAGLKPKFIPYLVKILARVMPAARILKKIRISSIKFSPDLIDSLVNAISSSKTLNRVSFINIELADKGCTKLLKQISPYQFEKVTFKNCGITSRSYKAFMDFIQRLPPSPTVQKTIRTIIIEGSSMTPTELDNIDYLLNEPNYSDGADYENEEEDDVQQQQQQINPENVKGVKQMIKSDSYENEKYEEEEDDEGENKQIIQKKPPQNEITPKQNQEDDQYYYSDEDDPIIIPQDEHQKSEKIPAQTNQGDINKIDHDYYDDEEEKNEQLPIHHNENEVQYEYYSDDQEQINGPKSIIKQETKTQGEIEYYDEEEETNLVMNPNMGTQIPVTKAPVLDEYDEEEDFSNQEKVQIVTQKQPAQMLDEYEYEEEENGLINAIAEQKNEIIVDKHEYEYEYDEEEDIEIPKR